MQGSGPDDYGAPDMLETYLYRHPMGMLEFWVDDGGIAGGGFKSSFRKLMKSVGKRIGMVSKHAKSRAKAHLEDMQNQGKAKLHEKLEEGRAQAEKVAREAIIEKAKQEDHEYVASFRKWKQEKVCIVLLNLDCCFLINIVRS